MLLSNGRIAQLGEHLPYKQRVTGSSPVVPTKSTRFSRILSIFIFIYFLQAVKKEIHFFLKKWLTNEVFSGIIT